ncbi:retrovirus-related pol polyprotein from transposon TNT 1-94 [Tanacetum coccineum]
MFCHASTALTGRMFLTASNCCMSTFVGKYGPFKDALPQISPFDLVSWDNSVSNQSAPSFDQLFELNELKAQSQEKDTVIKKLKERINALSGKKNEDKIKQELEEIETINIELDHRDDLRKLKGKVLVDNDGTKHPSDPKMLKINVEPITPKLLNKQTAHSAYIKHTQEEATVLRDLVEHVKSKYPLDQSLESACRYAKLVQELLTNISKTCPSINNADGKLVAVTPKNKDKSVRFTKPVTSSGNTITKTTSTSNLVSNKPMLSSTGVKPSTSASGSQPSGNTKKDKIRQTPSSTQKNKVEAHPRKVKSSLKNKDCVVQPKGTAHVQHSKLNANSELKCVKCNGCMLSDNHDLCVLDFINNVNARKKSKSVNKSSKRKVWKPTGKVFTNIGYIWRPTDSGCSKHMTEDRSQLTNFINKFLGTVKFGNDHVAKILGYGDYQIRNVTISRVYYVEGLGHNLFFVWQFCDLNFKVAFRQHTCFIRNLEGVDLLNGSRGNNLYTLSLGDMMASSPICLLSKLVGGVKGPSAKNMDFLSSSSITNDVNTSYGVSTANTHVSSASTQVSTASTQDLKQIHKDDIEEMDLKWQLALLSMRTRRFFQKTGEKVHLTQGVTQLDKTRTKVECFQLSQDMTPPDLFVRECQRPRNQKQNMNRDKFRRTANLEETPSKAMLAIDGAASKILDKLKGGTDILIKVEKCTHGFVSYNVVPPPPTRLFSPPNLDLSYSGLEEFQQPEFEGYGLKPSKSVSKILLMRSPSLGEIKETGIMQNPNSYEVTLYYNKACFVCGSFNNVQANYNYHHRERVVSGNNYTRVNYNYFAKKTHSSAQRNMVPRAVLTKLGLRSLNTARPVNTAHPKTIVYSARPMSHFPKLAHLTVKRPYQTKTALTNKNSTQKVNTAKGKFYTTRPNSAVVNAMRENQVNAVKASACWMCDKKNSVLFTDTGCFVLSPDFKLTDESQVLLKVPRKNNMYSVDIKNIIPKESLTCLVAKATLDESMLWHRRLGHVNFKTINKLLKENLVRGLPIKRFENDQTCVACLKGKQHKASYKSKTENSITQPLFTLHTDLFGPIL